MTKRDILLIQAETDLMELRKDVDAGLYKNDLVGFLQRMEKIEEKINEALKSQNNELDRLEAERCAVESLEER